MKKNITLALLVLSVLLGGFLIETHTTAASCLFGIGLWGFATYLSGRLMKAVPGLPLFSGTRLTLVPGKNEWKWPYISLLSCLILALVAASKFSLEYGHWWLVLIFSLAVGGFFVLLEDHSPAFWTVENKKTKSAWWDRPYLIETIFLLVGAFFLFYQKPGMPYFFHTNGDCDHSFLQTLYCSTDSGFTTPYVNVWTKAQPAFMYFWSGQFLKVIGVSLLHEIIYSSLFNLVGLFFFYRFLCFYLSKPSAGITTILLAVSHWQIFFVRQTYVDTGFVVPMLSITLYFFARAVEKGKPADFAILGTLFACDMMSHITVRFISFYLFLDLLLVWLLYRKMDILKQRRGWILVLIVFLVWYLPMYIHNFQFGDRFGVIDTTVFSEYGVWSGHSEFPWDAFYTDFQMFTHRTRDAEMLFLPYLSPWEGIFMVCGFGWCLWRFYNPAFFILLLCFFAEICPDALTNDPTNPHRAIAVIPFLYCFIGIGLDRLGKLLSAPLAQAHRAIGQYLFLGVFVFLSVLWHYDVLFNQFPKTPLIYNEPTHMYGTLTSHYLKGWDIYDDADIYTTYRPEDGFYYSRDEMGNRKVPLLRDFPLPLKEVPEKGALLLLSDNNGKAFGQWINYYYPDVPEKLIYDSFGNVQFRTWTLTPDNIRKALTENKPFPHTGLILTCYGANNRKMGQWHVPTLCGRVIKFEWLPDPSETTPFLWKNVAYFIASGYLGNTDGKTLAIQTTGQVTGVVNNHKVLLKNPDPLALLEIPSAKDDWVSFKLRYIPMNNDFRLTLLQHDQTGWDFVPPSEFKTALGN